MTRSVVYPPIVRDAGRRRLGATLRVFAITRAYGELAGQDPEPGQPSVMTLGEIPQACSAGSQTPQVIGED